MGYMTCYSLVVGGEGHEVAEERREEAFAMNSNASTNTARKDTPNGTNTTRTFSASRGRSPRFCSYFGTKAESRRICGSATTSAVGCKKRPPGSSISPSAPTSSLPLTDHIAAKPRLNIAIEGAMQFTD